MKKGILFFLALFCVILLYSQSTNDYRKVQLSAGLGVMVPMDYHPFAHLSITPRAILWNMHEDISMSIDVPLALSLSMQASVTSSTYGGTTSSSSSSLILQLPMVLDFNFFLGANTFKSTQRKAGFFLGGGYCMTATGGSELKDERYFSPTLTGGFHWGVGSRSMGIRYTQIVPLTDNYPTFIITIQYNILK